MLPESSNLPRRSRSSKWGWAAVLVASSVVVACEGSVTIPGTNQTWGFITVAAAKTSGGDYKTAPIGQFFKGAINAVPNAAVKFDSCIPGLAYSPVGEIVTGVTFLDAGDQITAKFGGADPDPLPRLTSATSTTYQVPSGNFIAYTPGDSIVVNIPGATAGFPAAEIHGKTAEPFTIDPIVPPTGNQTIQLHWTPATDENSAMILSLRYAIEGSSTINRQLLCAFTDDGADSIPFRQHQFWSNSTNTQREVVATRLRTSIVSRTDGVLEILSRFQVPTPLLP
jgi:hypothetical protein